MSLLEQVTRDMAQAMKAHDQVRLAALRMLKTALTNREVERGRALDATESMQVVQSLVKQRRDSIELFERGGREELAAKERAEIAVLEAYLPAAVPEEEIEQALREAIAETGAQSPKDMGKVMKALTTRFAGRPIDGKALSERVKRALSGS
ncbi:MAG TPA: GatB/YqeY domain-containing protein [Vicinamibacterales bacterium]